MMLWILLIVQKDSLLPLLELFDGGIHHCRCITSSVAVHQEC